MTVDDPYLITGTDTLLNLPGISDPERLAQFEAGGRAGLGLGAAGWTWWQAFPSTGRRRAGLRPAV